MGAPYIYDISRLKVNILSFVVPLFVFRISHAPLIRPLKC